MNYKATASVFLTAVFGLWALISLFTGARNAIRPTGSQDFGQVYKSSRLWLHAQNPYAAYSPEAWQKVTDAASPLNLPVVAAYSTPYTPIALIDLAPTAVFQWEMAQRLWLLLNLLFALSVPFLVAHLWYSHWSRAARLAFMFFWLGGISLRIGVGNGQHTLLWFCCTLGALSIHRSGRAGIAGSLLALSFHKLNMAAVFISVLVFRKWWRTLSAMVPAGIVLLIVFAAPLHAIVPNVARSYVAEIGWWSRQMEGGGLQGLGSSHLLLVLSAIFGENRFTVLLMYALAAIGFGACAHAGYSRRDSFPGDLEIAGVMLLILWVMYNSTYSEIVLIVPIAALYDLLSNDRIAGLLWRTCAVCEAALIGIWFVDARKIWSFFGGSHDLAVAPSSAFYTFLDLEHRVVIFAAFVLVIYLQWRISGEVRALSPRGSEAVADELPERSGADGLEVPTLATPRRKLLKSAF